MIRPFLSVLVAGLASAVGVSLVASGGAGSRAQQAMLGPGTMPVDPTPAILIVVGTVLLGAAAFSLALHWLGPLVVGAVHAVLGLLALVLPFGSPFEGGIFSPVYQITMMFNSVDRWLGDGLSVFFFSGTSLVMGAFLVAAALGVRSRRLAPPASFGAALVTSVISGVTLIGSVLVLLFLGGQFVMDLFRMLQHNGILAGVVVVGCGVLAGVGGLLLRWSSTGAIIAAVVTVVVGVAVLIDPLRLGPAFSGFLVGGYGFVLTVGVTFLGAALGGLVRGPAAVPVGRDAL